MLDLTTEFTSVNTTSGSYNISWTLPSPINGSYYQILNYSFYSAYTIGPLYDGSSSVMLDQTQNYYYLPNVLYSTNYTFTITTINTKYGIDNGPAEIVTKTDSAGMSIFSTKTAICKHTALHYTTTHMNGHTHTNLQAGTYICVM